MPPLANRTVSLILVSVISLLLLFHLADDMVRGMSPGGLQNMIFISIYGVLVYLSLALEGRRSGYVLLLVLGLFATGMPIIHMRGTGVGLASVRSNGLFFIWTLLTLGVIGIFTMILSAHSLWMLRRRKPN
jgi:hypothetical protein